MQALGKSFEFQSALFCFSCRCLTAGTYVSGCTLNLSLVFKSQLSCMKTKLNPRTVFFCKAHRLKTFPFFSFQKKPKNVHLFLISSQPSQG